MHALYSETHDYLFRTVKQFERLTDEYLKAKASDRDQYYQEMVTIYDSKLKHFKTWIYTFYPHIALALHVFETDVQEESETIH